MFNSPVEPRVRGKIDYQVHGYAWHQVPSFYRGHFWALDQQEFLRQLRNQVYNQIFNQVRCDLQDLWECYD